MMMTLAKFREELDKITNDKINKEVPIRQSILINSLKSQYRHSITLESPPNDLDDKTDCFKYVFKDVIFGSMWQSIEEVHQENNNNSIVLISNLISDGFLALHDEKKEDDNIVVYFEKNMLKHFAKIEGDKYISKWGRGHVWKHARWEIPSSYGDNIKYANRVNCDVLQKLLKRLLV